MRRRRRIVGRGGGRGGGRGVEERGKGLVVWLVVGLRVSSLDQGGGVGCWFAGIFT